MSAAPENAGGDGSPNPKKQKLEVESCVESKLLGRDWVSVSPTKDQPESQGAGSFKIMQFNTLADGELVGFHSV